MVSKQKIFTLIASLAFIASFFATTTAAAADVTWNGDSLIYNGDAYRKIALPSGDSNFRSSRCNTGGTVYIHVASPGLHAICFVGTSTSSAVFVYFPNGHRSTLPDGNETFVFGSGAKDDVSVKVEAKSSCSTNPDAGTCTGGGTSPGGGLSTDTDTGAGTGAGTGTGGAGTGAGTGTGGAAASAGEKVAIEDRDPYERPEELHTNCEPGSEGCCGGVKTSIIGGELCGGKEDGTENGTIFALLKGALNILTAGIGIAAVGGIAYGAFLYTTAENKPDQTKKAVGIITNVVIGIVAYGLMYVLLNFLIPGGIFT